MKVDLVVGSSIETVVPPLDVLVGSHGQHVDGRTSSQKCKTKRSSQNTNGLAIHVEGEHEIVK